MKKFFATLACAVLALATLGAQTPEEIISRMDQETAKFDAEGFSMVMEIKLPIIGAMATTIYTRGDKYKMVTDVKGEKVLNWSDGVTDWLYDPSKNEITITKTNIDKPSDAQDSKNMLDSVTEGYDVKIKKESSASWEMLCTKSKSNTKKDDPKTMTLIVSKATYLPISLKATMSGVTVTLRDFKRGISENEVTFDQTKYSGATIIDKR